LKQEL
jgi:hypothetical protein